MLIDYDLANAVRQAYELRTGRQIHWGTLPVAILEAFEKIQATWSTPTDADFERACEDACIVLISSLSSVFFRRWDTTRINALVDDRATETANITRVACGPLPVLSYPALAHLASAARAWAKNDEKDTMISLELATWRTMRMNLIVNGRPIDLRKRVLPPK